MNVEKDTTEAPKSGWRLKLGTWMFAIPFVMFFGAPVVIPLVGLSAGQAAAAIGGIVVAAEVIWFASIPLLGKQGFFVMKKKAFGFLKLKTGPIGKSRHRIGVKLFWIGLGGQLLLHTVMTMAYAIVGAHPERVILGMAFEQQLAAYFSVLVFCVVCFITGIYAMGAAFAGRFKHAFDWSSE